jgi:hypothetical protein
MKATIVNWHDLTEQRFSPCLSVGVVYGGSEDHQHATAVCEFLAGQLAESSEIIPTWWSTALVSDPKFSRAAAQAAANSDLILFSLHCRSVPTPEIKNWLQSWPWPHRANPQLLALLHRARTGEGVMEWKACLKTLARRRNMAYVDGPAAAFATTPLWTEPDFEPAYSLADEMQRIEPYLHWGLNE